MNAAPLYFKLVWEGATVGENIIAAIKMQNNFWYPLKMVIFQYIVNNIGLFSIAPHLVIALLTIIISYFGVSNNIFTDCIPCLLTSLPSSTKYLIMVIFKDSKTNQRNWSNN